MSTAARLRKGGGLNEGMVMCRTVGSAKRPRGVLVSLGLVVLVCGACFAGSSSEVAHEKPGFWQEGLVGVCGARATWWTWLLAANGTLVASVLVGYRLGYSGTQHELAELGGASRWRDVGVVLGAVWLAVAWGLPGSVLEGVVWVPALVVQAILTGAASEWGAVLATGHYLENAEGGGAGGREGR